MIFRVQAADPKPTLTDRFGGPPQKSVIQFNITFPNGQPAPLSRDPAN